MCTTSPNGSPWSALMNCPPDARSSDCCQTTCPSDNIASCTKSMLHRSTGPHATGAGPRWSAQCFPAPHAHAQLQALEAVEPAHPFAIHERVLPAEQHPDPLKAETRTRVRELANPHADAVCNRASLGRRYQARRLNWASPHARRQLIWNQPASLRPAAGFKSFGGAPRRACACRA
jgi:hypothetical protein